MSDPSFFKNKPETWWQMWLHEHYSESAFDKTTETRGKILLAAFEEIYECGFQAASLNNILKNTSITKGALYHHFKSKMELGYAVVKEVIYVTFKSQWIMPLEKTNDPITVIQEILHQSGDQLTENDIRLGCPLNNLAIEMSPIDEEFRNHITSIYTEWQEALEQAFDRGKIAGKVRSDVDSKQLAVLFVATLDGCLGLAKSTQSLDTFTQCGQGLYSQLELLRSLH